MVTKHHFKQFSQRMLKENVGHLNDLHVIYLQGAMEQLIDLSRNHFKDEDLFGNKEERFQELIVTILQFMENLPQEITGKRQDETVKFIESSLISIKNFLYLIQRGYKRRIQTHVDKSLILTQLKSLSKELLEFFETWKGQLCILSTKREAAMGYLLSLIHI